MLTVDFHDLTAVRLVFSAGSRPAPPGMGDAARPWATAVLFDDRDNQVNITITSEAEADELRTAGRAIRQYLRAAAAASLAEPDEARRLLQSAAAVAVATMNGDAP